VLGKLIIHSGVQPVEDSAYAAIVALGDNGGWESLSSPKSKPATPAKPTATNSNEKANKTMTSKRKAADHEQEQAATPTTRRSKRNK
jgi:hypothetical protein